jgi:hypothetical protein
MKARSLPIFLLSATLVTAGISYVGCRSAVYVTFNGAEDSLSYAEFNEEIARETLNVLSGHGRTRTSQKFHIAPDSCVWIDGATGDTLQAPISEIHSALLTDRWGGLWRGFLYGGLVGFGGGYALASSDAVFEHERLAKLGLVLGSFCAGLLVGSVYGVIQGYEHDYHFKPYEGGATVVHLNDGSRMFGTIEEIIPEKRVVMRTWDGDRCVIDHAVIRKIDIPPP